MEAAVEALAFDAATWGLPRGARAAQPDLAGRLGRVGRSVGELRPNGRAPGYAFHVSVHLPVDSEGLAASLNL
jgi:hypothetical protein